MHGGIGRYDAVFVGKDNKAIGHQQGISECRIRVTGRANYLAAVINLHKATRGAHLTGHSAMMRMLERRKDVPIGKAHVGMRMHVSVHVRK